MICAASVLPSGRFCQVFDLTFRSCSEIVERVFMKDVARNQPRSVAREWVIERRNLSAVASKPAWRGRDLMPIGSQREQDGMVLIGSPDMVLSVGHGVSF